MTVERESVCDIPTAEITESTVRVMSGRDTANSRDNSTLPAPLVASQNIRAVGAEGVTSPVDTVEPPVHVPSCSNVAPSTSRRVTPSRGPARSHAPP